MDIIPGWCLLINKPLLDVVFASEKRKNVLSLLKEGPQEMEQLLISLNTTRQALLPQMRILEDHYLVIHSKDSYELTTIGKLIVDEMAPLMDTFEVLDVDIDYWGTHNLDFIPPYLLKRIDELGTCEIATPSIVEIFEVLKEFYKTSKMSESVFLAITYYHPHFPLIFSELIQLNIHTYVIISQELLDKLEAQPDHAFERLIGNNYFHLYVYPKEMGFISFGYNDYCLRMSLLTRSCEYDNKYILSYNPSSLRWAKDLFDHCLKNSTPVALR